MRRRSKNMKKRTVSIFVALMLVISVLMITGCSKDKGDKESKKSIIGSWKNDTGYDFIYTFDSDNTGSYTAFGNKMNFTYEDDGTKVTILYRGNTTPSTYEYRIDGNKLIIKDSFGEDMEYVKCD